MNPYIKSYFIIALTKYFNDYSYDKIFFISVAIWLSSRWLVTFLYARLCFP